MSCPATSAISEALDLLANQPWDAQEASYSLLAKLIQNPMQNPNDPKYRSVKRAGAALKSKLLDVPGGSAALMAAGFREETDAYILPADVSVDLLQATLQVLQQHAEAKKLESLRAERDTKIAKAKDEEAELAKFGGFARGMHKLGGAYGGGSVATPAIPCPVINAYAMDDPRQPGEQVGVVAFYYPGREEPWDRICRASFLGNFFPQPKGEEIRLAPPSFPEQEHSFTNAEAAFQALKLWKYVDKFENVNGSGAFQLKKQYFSESDMTYSGYKSNWHGMLGVLRQKYRAGTVCADALVATGDSFLLEHNGTSGRDLVWSDNKVGDGTNWLGLQLMLLRDELNASKDAKTWTSYVESLLDLQTGRPLNNQWQNVIKAACALVNA